MENYDKFRKLRRQTSDDDGEMQQLNKRNPSILFALDAVHRSLLNNNLQYDAVEGKWYWICVSGFYLIVSAHTHVAY